MPTVRELAVELRINPNTVARAYRELLQLGVLETRGALGSYVANGQVRQGARRREEEYRVRVREALRTGAALGVDPAVARAIFEELAREAFREGE